MRTARNFARGVRRIIFAACTVVVGLHSTYTFDIHTWSLAAYILCRSSIQFCIRGWTASFYQEQPCCYLAGIEWRSLAWFLFAKSSGGEALMDLSARNRLGPGHHRHFCNSLLQRACPFVNLGSTPQLSCIPLAASWFASVPPCLTVRGRCHLVQQHLPAPRNHAIQFPTDAWLLRMPQMLPCMAEPNPDLPITPWSHTNSCASLATQNLSLLAHLHASPKAPRPACQGRFVSAKVAAWPATSYPSPRRQASSSPPSPPFPLFCVFGVRPIFTFFRSLYYTRGAVFITM